MDSWPSAEGPVEKGLLKTDVPLDWPSTPDDGANGLAKADGF